MAAANGTELHLVRGTRGGFHPILSPDGHTLAFARERIHRLSGGWFCCVEVSVWLLDLSSALERRLTPWRSELAEVPSSFSPDGSILAVSSEEPMGPLTRHTALAFHLNGGGKATVLDENAMDPVYSPDGAQVALVVTHREIEPEGIILTPTDLAVASSDGSNMRVLTHTTTLEGEPSWDPSGQRLAYTRTAPRGQGLFGLGDSLMEINADGTCPTEVLSFPHAALVGAAWQPGPGRAAGPISC